MPPAAPRAIPTIAGELATKQGQLASKRPLTDLITDLRTAEAAFAPLEATYQADEIVRNTASAVTAAKKGLLIAKLNEMRAKTLPGSTHTGAGSTGIDDAIAVINAATTDAEIDAFVTGINQNSGTDFFNGMRPHFNPATISDAEVRQFLTDTTAVATDYKNALTADATAESVFAPKRIVYQQFETAKQAVKEVVDLQQEIANLKYELHVEQDVAQATRVNTGAAGVDAARIRPVVTGWVKAAHVTAAKPQPDDVEPITASFDYSTADTIKIELIQNKKPPVAAITPAAGGTAPPVKICRTSIQVINALHEKNTTIHVSGDEADDDIMMIFRGAVGQFANGLTANTYGNVDKKLRYIAIADHMRESGETGFNKFKIKGIHAWWLRRTHGAKIKALRTLLATNKSTLEPGTRLSP